LGADVNVEPRLAVDDLVAAAKAEVAASKAGAEVASARSVRRWVQFGLLDRPVVRGRGRGQGVLALWSDNQLRLFVELTRAQQRGASIPSLCNLPIWLWVWWGDSYVPLRQVRRALETWASARTRPSWSDALTVARAVVGKLAIAGTRRAVLRLFRQTIADQAAGAFDPDTLRAAAKDAIEGEARRRRGPIGAQLDAARYADLVAMRFEALDHLDGLSEDDFESARLLLHHTKADYERKRPTFEADPDLGHLFSDTTQSDEINLACLDLVTALGAVRRLRSVARGNA